MQQKLIEQNENEFERDIRAAKEETIALFDAYMKSEEGTRTGYEMLPEPEKVNIIDYFNDRNKEKNKMVEKRQITLKGHLMSVKTSQMLQIMRKSFRRMIYN